MSREPLKTKNFKADETEKAELTMVNEHFEVEVQRRNSKFLEVPSKYFSTAAIRGVNRIGDVMIPRNGSLPSYSEFGGAEHLDDLLAYAPEKDIKDLNLILSILSFMPRFVLRWLVTKMTKSHHAGDGISVVFRQLDLGLKGLILSTYYTEKSGSNYTGKAPLDIIGYSINRIYD